jgi:LysM repeat protein
MPGKEIMRFIRVLTLVLTLVVGVLVAIQPTQAKAQVTQPIYYSAPVVVSTAVAHTEPVTYVVKKGDSLAIIAPRYHLTWQSLYCDNKKLIGSNPNVISPGERMQIPSKNMTCKIVLPAVEHVTPYIAPKASAPATEASVTSYTSQASGSLQSYALELVGGSQQQFSCLNSIINSESSWNVYAANPSSGAYGIPQALPGSKMSVAGADWATNGYTQLKWMVADYVNPVYGSACGAWTFHLAHGYY